MSSCIFCKIANKEIPAKIVGEDSLALAFWDINPQAPTHLLIVPKKHIPAVMDLTPQDSESVWHLYLLAQELAKSQGVERNGFRLVVNNGREAGQSVDHLHMHFLAGRKLQWPPG